MSVCANSPSQWSAPGRLADTCINQCVQFLKNTDIYILLEATRTLYPCRKRLSVSLAVTPLTLARTWVLASLHVLVQRAHRYTDFCRLSLTKLRSTSETMRACWADASIRGTAVTQWRRLPPSGRSAWIARADLLKHTAAVALEPCMYSALCRARGAPVLAPCVAFDLCCRSRPQPGPGHSHACVPVAFCVLKFSQSPGEEHPGETCLSRHVLALHP